MEKLEETRSPPAPFDPDKAAMIKKLAAEVEAYAALILGDEADGGDGKGHHHAFINGGRLKRVLDSVESQDTSIQVLMEVAEEQKAVSRRVIKSHCIAGESTLLAAQCPPPQAAAVVNGDKPPPLPL